MAECQIRRLVLGMIQTNCYLVKNEETSQIVVIDPADHEEEILKQAALLGGRVGAILLTHGHYDHILAADPLRKATHACIYAMAEEKDVLEDAQANVSEMFGAAMTLQADKWLMDGQKAQICGLVFDVLHTPGHTKGSGSYYMAEQKALFSGDTLFAGGYGRYDLPTGNLSALVGSIRKKLLVLPEDTKVLPGHGGQSTIKQEKQQYGVL